MNEQKDANHPNLWSAVEEQLKASNVASGTALEKLVQDNQDFHLLRPEEANDKIGLPPWLRVHWRKNHPEGNYSAGDPTGGYPRVLKNVHAWMMANQHLPSGQEEAPASRNGGGDKDKDKGKGTEHGS